MMRKHCITNKDSFFNSTKKYSISTSTSLNKNDFLNFIINSNESLFVNKEKKDEVTRRQFERFLKNSGSTFAKLEEVVKAQTII